MTALERLEVVGNGKLAELADLGAVVAVAGSVESRDNDALTAVAGMGSLTTVDGRLVVLLNPALPQVDAVAWGAGIEAAFGRKSAGPARGSVECDAECDDMPHGLGICLDGSDLEDCMVSN